MVIMMTLLRGLLNGADDAHVRTAAAEVYIRRRLIDAGQEVCHLLVGWDRVVARAAPTLQPIVGTHHDPGDAVGALPGLVVEKGFLDPAQKASGQNTKKQTVEDALRLLVRLRRQQEAVAAFGKFRWRGNIARSRRGRPVR
jgi:hypothetical protein